MLTEIHLVRRGASRLRPGFDADVRLHQRCDGCGARHAVEAAA